MALHADTVWEVRTAGNNNNGGGWHDAGGASADHSQQDAHNETWTNLSVNSTTLTDDDAGGNFTASMLGNIINVLTKGRFEIATVTDGNNVELDRAVAAGSGLTGYEGGAVAHPEEIEALIVAGNTIYLKSGTYNLTGNFLTVTANATNRVLWIGYNSSRDDDPEPSSGNQPVIAGSTYAVQFQDHTFVKFIEFTTEYSGGIIADQYVVMFKCKSTNTAGTAGYPGFSVTNSYCAFIGCEGISTNGSGLKGGNFIGVKWLYCYAHDCGQYGIDAVSIDDFVIAFCICEHNEDGILGGDQGVFLHNTVDGNTDDGIVLTGIELIFNNQITNNGGHGVDNTAAMQTGVFLDYNNWYNNTGGDVDNVVKGPNATANDPGYTNATGGDFSGVDDANAFGIRLGVG